MQVLQLHSSFVRYWPIFKICLQQDNAEVHCADEQQKSVKIPYVATLPCKIKKYNRNKSQDSVTTL